MDNRTLGIVLIVVAVLAMTSAQLLIKARLDVHGAVPLSAGGLFGYALALLADWQAWLGGIGLIAASVLWYVALSRIPISLAFPFAALSYPIIFAGSLLFLREGFSWQVLAGNVAIVVGILLVAGAAGQT